MIVRHFSLSVSASRRFADHAKFLWGLSTESVRAWYFARVKMCLCGQSSISAWRHYDNRVPYVPVFGHTPGSGPAYPRAFPSEHLGPGVPLSEFDHDRDFVHAKDLTRWGIQQGDPVHLLVGRRLRERSLGNGVYHSIAIEDGLAPLFLEIEPGLCATSPELTFIMAANELDFLSLVLLGYELCGCYSLVPQCGGGLMMRHPLTSVERIANLANSLSVKGVGPARRALRYVLDGSGSPQETALAMMLSLPKRYGGFGFVQPQLNLRLELSNAASVIWPRGNAFDLVWDSAKIVVEYDGEAGHTLFEQTERDNARRNALAIDGYALFVLTKSQIANVEGFFSIAKAMAKLLNCDFRIREEGFWGKHLALREKVLANHR